MLQWQDSFCWCLSQDNKAQIWFLLSVCDWAVKNAAHPALPVVITRMLLNCCLCCSMQIQKKADSHMQYDHYNIKYMKSKTQVIAGDLFEWHHLAWICMFNKINILLTTCYLLLLLLSIKDTYNAAFLYFHLNHILSQMLKQVFGYSGN